MNKRFLPYSRGGFTFPELIIVMGIIATLYAFASMNLFGAKNAADLDTGVATFIADVKIQQMKAMTGATGPDGNPAAFGVHLTQTGYSLFSGQTYEDRPQNTNVTLGENLEFSSILLPDSQIVFASGSGEIANFDAALKSVTVSNIRDGIHKTIIVNSAGTATSVN